MLQELWHAIRGLHGPTPKARGFEPSLPAEDEPDSIVAVEEPPTHGLEAISGLTCIISYTDARGRASQRRITCIRLEEAGSERYVRAFCHERGSNRQFKLSRIEVVADFLTAEIVSEDPVEFFGQFQIGYRQRTKMGWGLSVQQRADLLAGMNALVFMARCDKEWHPAERDEIERFVCGYWLRAELAGEPPLDDIMQHAARLSPDPEVFFVSLTRCAERPVLAQMIRRGLQSVVDADGRIHDNEFYWGQAVDDYFRSLEH